MRLMLIESVSYGAIEGLKVQVPPPALLPSSSFSYVLIFGSLQPFSRPLDKAIPKDVSHFTLTDIVNLPGQCPQHARVLPRL